MGTHTLIFSGPTCSFIMLIVLGGSETITNVEVHAKAFSILWSYAEDRPQPFMGWHASHYFSLLYPFVPCHGFSDP